MDMERAPSQLHTNSSPQKQFHVRITFEDEHVFTKGPLNFQSYQKERALKATLTLQEFSELKNSVGTDLEQNSRTPVELNITSYVRSVLRIVGRLIESADVRDRERTGSELKVQIWHLKGQRSGAGASQHSNSAPSTCSQRVWCIDSDGLDPSSDLLNQTVETNVDPMDYLLNMKATRKRMKSWIYEPQHQRPNSGLSKQAWECSEHQTKGVEHVVIFQRSNLEGITACGERESFDKMLHSWRSKAEGHQPNDRYNVPEFVKQFGLKPCYTINNPSESETMKDLTFQAKAVDAITKLYMTSYNSSTSDLPVIGLPLTRNEFCDVFDIPPEIGKHIVAGGVCAVKQKNNFKHLPDTKKAYDDQTVTHSLKIRRVNIRLIEQIQGGKFLIRSSWQDAPDLSIS